VGSGHSSVEIYDGGLSQPTRYNSARFRVSDIVQIVAYRIRGVAKMPYPHVGRAILPAAGVYRRAHKQEPPRKAAAARIVCPTFVNQL
jgi:hypothetical protein